MFVIELKEYIFNNNKIPFILEELGCHNIQYHNSSKNYWSASFPDGDNPNGINIDNNERLSYCSWSRDVNWSDGQDLISLVEYIKHDNFINSFKWLHEILGLEYKHNDYKRKSKPTIDLKAKALSIFTNHLSNNSSINVKNIEVLDEKILDEYVPIEHIDFLREGITPYACNKFDIEYSYKRQRIIIPQRLWNTGEIIGINARTTIKGYEELGINKYSFNKGFNKSINLYGLWENYNSILNEGYVVVYESEKSVLKRYSQFDETAVALGGKNVSEEQKRILVGLGVDIVIAMDNDVKINEVFHLCEKFYNVRNVYFIKDKDGILNKKDSPADAKDSDFRKLLKNKIKYDETLHNKYLQLMSA